MESFTIASAAPSRSALKTILLLIASGVISTLIMDIGGAIFRATGMTSGVPPELLGKWIESAMRGNVFVDDIRTSPGDTAQLGMFMIYHYLIGITLTFVFYFLMLLLKIRFIKWWMPIVYGLATTLIPAFIMFPGMGFGMMGTDGPDEYLLLRTAIINHLFYGIGLMLAFRWLMKNKI